MAQTKAEVALKTIPQVADALGCGKSHVYNLLSSGELRAVDISRTGRPKTRIRTDDLAAYIERQTRETRKGAAA